ncbi:MAG TPA: hypothetical protein VK184_10330 [Nostocaceae cyanobacterium]|nr:hypothetical protein [Nostocaceae cyanobacterium]
MENQAITNQTPMQTPPATVMLYTVTQIQYNIAMERLRQARYSFNLSLFAAAVSVLVSLLGAGLMLRGSLPQGTITTAVGMVASAGCVKLAKDANDRLDQIWRK